MFEKAAAVVLFSYLTVLSIMPVMVGKMKPPASKVNQNRTITNQALFKKPIGTETQMQKKAMIRVIYKALTVL